MDSLQASPPRSLHQLYTILLDELSRVRAQLTSLEFEFYSQDGTEDDAMQAPRSGAADSDVDAYAFICRWAPVAKEVMQCHSLAELNSMRQMQSAIVLGRDPELREAQPDLKHIKPETCIKLTRLQNRLLAYVPSRFTGMIDATGRVQALCDKYLLSFYTLNLRQAPIETAKKYTVNRREWNSKARDCLNNALYNPHLFLRDCLRLGRMQKSTLALLNRADIITAPVVGLFTDECAQLRAALDALEEWIEHDQGYASFIAADLAELEKRRGQLKTSLTELRHRLHTSQFRTRSLQAEKARLQVELASLTDRESELLQAEEQLYQEVNSVKIDCEMKEFRRDEIKRASKESAESEQETELDPAAAQLLLKQLKEQLRILRHSIPQMERRMLALRSKLSVIDDKHRRFNEVSETLRDSEKETLRLKNEVSSTAYQLEQCQLSLDQCAQIHRLKTAADTTSKVFHGMPLETRAAQEAATQKMLHRQHQQQQKAPGSDTNRSDDRGKVSLPAINQQSRGTAAAAAATVTTARTLENPTDGDGSPFDRVCLLVSRRIEIDWKRLYRALPFVPQRGRETIDRDIEELQTGLVGESRAQCAWRALHRWRRFHRRAKPGELRAALVRLRRTDLLPEVDACLAPPAAPTVVKETPLPANIAKELVPYYRQVERYDNLVMARRSKEAVK
ncbi:hypothetical protein BOX15_Mlig031852g2 [Macrostomum lignano]|uniref:Death domain-containing protein n=1 Tax=Macrostomum lignano TaxID=282301 RepID=A0A267G6P3_9PLAT|nr:hypothetical protein BOX15_Mlig031852g2 [Macrostomum lignano]